MGPEHKETNIPILKETTTVVQSKADLDALTLLPKTSDLTFETHRSTVEEDSAIDSSSIPTQTALQFFMSKIKESEDGSVSKPIESRDPVDIPVQQKLTDKISMFERREQEERSVCKSPEFKEPIPVTKLSDKINLFEKYEGKPETREETKKFEDQIWKSYKHEPAQPTPGLPDFTEPYMPDKQVTTDVQHSRVVKQETKTWSGTIQVPGKIVPSTYTQPIVFKEESKTASYQKHFATPEPSSSAMQDEYGLHPEPPPEMCYTPKMERAVKVREDMAERVKKLQDSQKSLDPFQVPTGAVRIFPAPAPSSQPGTPQTPRAQPRTQQPAATPHTPSFLYPGPGEQRATVQERHETSEEVKEEPMVRQVLIDESRTRTKNAETVGGGVWTTPIAAAVEVSPLPANTMSSFTSTNTTSSSSFMQQSSMRDSSAVFQSSGPILRPAASEIPLRATSPRPAAEAISMERLWTSHRTSESENTTAFKPVSPKLPVRPASPKLPVRPVSDGYTMSRDFSSEARTYSSTEQKRGPSPRPSSEGLAMERLWAPHKPFESSLPAPPVAERPVSPRPSSEGLAMDKTWSHKAVKRSWPPPKAPEVEKISIPWAPQNEPEKVWSPEAEPRDKMFEFERRELSKELSKELSAHSEQREVQGFRHVNPPAAPASPAARPVPQDFADRSFLPVQTPPVTSSMVSSEVCETRSEQLGSSSWSKTSMSSTEQVLQQSSIVEEKHLKPSEAKRSWPPNKPEYDLQSPFMVRKMQKVPLQRTPAPVPAPAPCEPPVNLEPGPPPEMGFAAPPSERRRSMVESIEEDLEKTLEKEPSRVVPGGVRVIPPPQPKGVSSPAPKDEPFSWKHQDKSFERRSTTMMKKEEFSSVSSKSVEPLEPFPFQPEPERPKPRAAAPPAKPSRFLCKADFGGSDYESDLETCRISTKWRPAGSDTEEPAYRRVRPPSAPVFTAYNRAVPEPRSEPAPPSAFERPASLYEKQQPQSLGSINSSSSTARHEFKSSRVSSNISSSIASTQSRFGQQQTQRPAPVVAPLDLKPGSPPTYVQPEIKPALKTTPGSPKSKHKSVRVVVPPESGYMADTDEPRTLQRGQRLKSPPHPQLEQQKYESRSEMYESSSRMSSSMVSEQSSSVQSMSLSSSCLDKAAPPATVARPTNKVNHRHERKATSVVSAFKVCITTLQLIDNRRLCRSMFGSFGFVLVSLYYL